LAQVILNRASISRASGEWGDDDYDVLEDGVVVGRIFLSPATPRDRPWMWASGHDGQIRRAAHGYAVDARGGDGGIREELATGAKGGRLDSERTKPFVDIATLFAEKWHQ
jgi:hypothetical protein